MKGITHISGIIGLLPDETGQPMQPNTTFIDVVSSVEALKGITELDIVVNSPGGLVEEADLIFEYIQNLKKKGILVTTITETECASAAVKIFLAGGKRIIHDQAQFMIHNPFGQSPEGDADQIDQYSKGLRSIENDMINFYSQQTGTSKEAIKPLMKKETFLTSDQAVNLGFATEVFKRIPLNAVAFSQKLNHKLNTTKMAKEKEVILDKKGILAMIDNLGKGLTALLNGTGVKAMKTVLDANAVEIVFPELAEDDVPSVEDKTDAEDGTYLLPSGESYVVAGGILTEIIPVADPGGDPSEELASALERIKELEGQVSAMKTIQTENSTLKTEAVAMKAQVAELAKGLKTVQKSIGSGFDHQGKAKNHKKDDGKPAKRSMMKTEDQ